MDTLTLKVDYHLAGKSYTLQSSYATNGGIYYRVFDRGIQLVLGHIDTKNATLSDGISAAKSAIREVVDYGTK